MSVARISTSKVSVDFFISSRKFLHACRVSVLMEQCVQKDCFHFIFGLRCQSGNHSVDSIVGHKADKPKFGEQVDKGALQHGDARIVFVVVHGGSHQHGLRRGGSGASPVLHPHTVVASHAPAKTDTSPEASAA